MVDCQNDVSIHQREKWENLPTMRTLKFYQGDHL